MALNVFKSGIFPVKNPIQVITIHWAGTEIKILSPKQMIQRLPIAIAQLKASNNWKICSMKFVETSNLCINKGNHRIIIW